MRTFLITILTLSAFVTSAQTRQIKIFKKTVYINGSFYRQTDDTIKVGTEQADIYLFKRHFYIPYYLPERFVDKRYKGQMLSVWGDPTGKKDYQQNWENTYTYDSIGRVVQYTYSGCFICSDFSYNYTVAYNSLGQVERIFNSTNVKDSYVFYYNSKGEVVKLKKYSIDKLETEIVSVN